VNARAAAEATADLATRTDRIEPMASSADCCSTTRPSFAGVSEEGPDARVGKSSARDRSVFAML